MPHRSIHLIFLIFLYADFYLVNSKKSSTFAYCMWWGFWREAYCIFVGVLKVA